jgi:hypothetical protein
MARNRSLNRKSANISKRNKVKTIPSVIKRPEIPENVKNDKSLESWIWDAACSIRGAKDAPKYKDYILPLIFAKRLCDVFDDELDRIAKEIGSREKAFKLVKHDKKLVRFYLPLKPANPDAEFSLSTLCSPMLLQKFDHFG